MLGSKGFQFLALGSQCNNGRLKDKDTSIVRKNLHKPMRTVEVLTLCLKASTQTGENA